MSNSDRSPDLAVLEPGAPCTAVEVLEPRPVPLGGPRAMTVYRTLPQVRRSLVGAWCFLDHYGPDDVGSVKRAGSASSAAGKRAGSASSAAASGGMVVPRHPHTGLATVSWLFDGEIDHLDSAGNAARVRPGELNLMIAGRGITHEEISTADTQVLHGVQLWYALPDATRFSEHHFARYAPEPVSVDGATIRVFLGDLAGSSSPVATRTPGLLGAEVRLDPGASVALAVQRDFEHAVLAETGTVTVNGTAAQHRELAYVPTVSDTLVLTAGPSGARAILLGGVPLGEEILMWWNFIGRTHEEIEEYRRRYQAELGFDPSDPRDDGKPPLFGPYPPGQLAPWPAPPLPAIRLRARRNPPT